jgi:DNA adenine methylase
LGISNALRYSKAIIFAGDYRDAAENTKKRRFYLFGPAISAFKHTSYFTAYTTDGFDDRDHSQLADVFRKLNSRGCLLLLSNSVLPLSELYILILALRKLGSVKTYMKKMTL